MPKVCRGENSFIPTSLYKEEQKEKERKGESKRKGKRNLPCGSKEKQSMGEQLRKKLKKREDIKCRPFLLLLFSFTVKFDAK